MSARLILAALLLLLCPPVWSSMPDLHAWQWQRLVTLAVPGAEQCLVLDADVYSRSGPGLRDLRLLQDGREVPYALEESRDDHAQTSPDSDRSVYTTVLRIPLQRFYPAPAWPGQREVTAYRGEALLAAHVPVERMQFQAAASAPTASSDASALFSLAATPLTQQSRTQRVTRDSEWIDAMLPIASPKYLTAIGANLQNDAAVSAAVFSERYDAVLLQMRQRLLCFQPLSAAPLVMVFGNSSARPVRYEYSARYQPLARPRIATLGPTERNPMYRQQPQPAAWWTATHPMLVTSIGVLVVVLCTTLPLLLSRY